jgi:hypothetical protein
MDEETKIEAAARAAHEANRAWCLAIGDFSQPSWDNAPHWQKESARSGVRLIIADPGTTPRQSHENWLRDKTLDGWKYGPVKDVEKKEHPCFVPYDDLPALQRVKDSVFGAVVRSILAAAENAQMLGKG